MHSTRIEGELLCRRDDSTGPERPEIIKGDERIDLASTGFVIRLSALYRTTSLAC